MKIGVLGPRGNLGSYFVEECGYIPMYEDVRDIFALNRTLDNSWDVIINCSAYTDVDGAETDEGYKKALDVNYWGIANIFKTRKEKTRVIHISTDYIFDGETGPYYEDTIYRDSINSYGFSKLGGEITYDIYYRYGDCCIRTTGLYGYKKHDFLRLVYYWLKMEDDAFLATNQLHGNQTYIPHLAEGINHVIHNLSDYEIPVKLHIASKEVISRYEFALMIKNKFGLDNGYLLACSNNEIPSWKAERPIRAGLDVSLAESLGVPIYSIKDGLDAFVNTDVCNRMLEKYEV